MSVPAFKINKDVEHTEEKRQEIVKTNLVSPGSEVILNVENCLQQLEQNNISIANDYNTEYLTLAFSFASLGELGREYFHRVCSLCTEKYNYKDVDEQFTNARNTGRGSYTIASFFEMCKGVGVYHHSKKQEPIKEQIQKNIGFKMSLSYQRKHTKPMVYYSGSPALNHGEIGVIVALPGSGKTQISEMNAVACLVHKHNLQDIDTCGIEVHSSGKKCLYIDTERPNDDNRTSYDRICKRLNVEQNKFLLKGDEIEDLEYRVFTDILSLEERKKALEYHLSTEEYDFVVLDGVLDFAASLNDEKTSLEAVVWLRGLAAKYDCSIIVTLHPNKGTSDMAGHLGAFLYRYCRACFLIRPNANNKSVKEITLDFSQGKLSHADPSAFNPLYMTWDSEKNIFVSTVEPQKTDGTVYSEESIRYVFSEFLIKGISQVPSGQFHKAYAKHRGQKESTARKHIDAAIEDGLINREGKSKSTVLIYRGASD